jgi:tetratricopeptide (TPR) repeat protein
MSGGRKLTVRDKILVHLAPFSRFADEFECPEAMSQAGISLAIGKSRAHTTLELNRMKDADLVTERLAHVSGTRSRRKTYTLTNQALSMERQISEHIMSLEIQLSGSGDPGKTDGQKAAEALVRELPVSRAMAFDIILSSDGQVQLEKHRPPPVSSPIPDDEPDSLGGKKTIIHDDQTFDAIVLQAHMLSKRGRYRDALVILDRVTEVNPSEQEISRTHYSRASIYRKQGDYPAALEEINKSMNIAVESGKPLMVGRCQMEKAMILSGKGNEPKSLELLDSAEMVFRQENSQIDLLRCGINQGIILRNMGKIKEAVDVLDISLDLAERTSLDRLKAYALVNLTDLLNERKEYGRSRELASRARDVFQVLDEPLMFAAALFNLGTAQAALGEKEKAVTSFDNAISILERNEMLTSRTSWLEKYASILEELGETEKAKLIHDKI